jgi:hypothetical protein
MKVIEVKGSVDENRQLHLDEPLPIMGPSPVRIFILFPGEHEDEEQREPELDEDAWLRAAANNPTFDFLSNPAEDIYRPTDGKPFQHP